MTINDLFRKLDIEDNKVAKDILFEFLQRFHEESFKKGYDSALYKLKEKVE